MCPAGVNPQCVDDRQNTPAPDGCRTRFASSHDNTRDSPMKGIPVNRILSRTVRVAGSLAVVGGALAAGASPASAAPVSNNQAYGVSATGYITIAPVALAKPSTTPALSSGVVVPDFITTGGIMDRAAFNAAYSNVGSPKVQLFQQVDQLNATDVMSSCRTILGLHFGFTTIQGGLISTPSQPFLPPIPLPRNPGINDKITIPGSPNIHITLNKQTGSGPVGKVTVTAIYISGGGQTLSIGVSTCGGRRNVG